VLIDDLINKGTDEPYRIFTSRAEYRLQLRQDNADSRLMRKGHALGLIPAGVLARLQEKERRVRRAIARSKDVRLKPDRIAQFVREDLPTEANSLFHLLRRPGITMAQLLTLNHLREEAVFKELLDDKEALEQVDIEVKYEGYVKRQEEQIRLFERHENILIPEDFSFAGIPSLSTEGREKLQRVRPRSIGQASRISGVTPADISVLMISLLR
jgi:tRNA uridine 5-carboxymethylaminomethyl modification enzyme